MLLSWAFIAAGKSSLAALILGIAALDLGIQGAQITNQSVIYALDPEARSRLTTAYMASVFLGGIVGSTLSTTLYAAGGWHAVCVLGAALALAAIVVLVSAGITGYLVINGHRHPASPSPSASPSAPETPSAPASPSGPLRERASPLAWSRESVSPSA